MHLFYCPDISGSLYSLTEEESKHCIRVLRLKVGDTIHITDGRGNMHECRITDDHPKRCSVEVMSTSFTPARSPYRLHIAIAPTKNMERLEWFLEKVTEIGIDEITPLFCAHSERNTLKLARLEKVMISAMKQSLKSWLPLLNAPLEFDDFIGQPRTGQKFIAWCETDTGQQLKNLVAPDSDRLILIGPEGDFSATEVQTAIRNGFVPVSLGDNRLRTETAGVVACVISQIM